MEWKVWLEEHFKHSSTPALQMESGNDSVIVRKEFNLYYSEFKTMRAEYLSEQAHSDVMLSDDSVHEDMKYDLNRAFRKYSKVEANAIQEAHSIKMVRELQGYVYGFDENDDDDKSECEGNRNGDDKCESEDEGAGKGKGKEEIDYKGKGDVEDEDESEDEGKGEGKGTIDDNGNGYGEDEDENYDEDEESEVELDEFGFPVNGYVCEYCEEFMEHDECGCMYSRGFRLVFRTDREIQEDEEMAMYHASY